MNEHDAASAVGLIAGITPGPWPDEDVDAWIGQFEGLEDVDALMAAVTRVGREWHGLWRPPISAVLDEYRDELRRRQPALPPAGAQCDGSGWMPFHGRTVPCPRCSPAMAAIFADERKLREWRQGRALDQLDVGVRRARSGWVYDDDWTPPECRSAFEHEEPPVAPGEGREIARRAYIAERARVGREPDLGSPGSSA